MHQQRPALLAGASQISHCGSIHLIRQELFRLRPVDIGITSAIDDHAILIDSIANRLLVPEIKLRATQRRVGDPFPIQ